MYSAEDARRDKQAADPMKEWSILDQVQFQRIKKKIKGAVKRKWDDVEIGRSIRRLVKMKLEQDGDYTVFILPPKPGYCEHCTVRVSWKKILE